MSTVGIDLGASCKTGVWQRGRADVVANELGHRSSPSAVGFTDDDLLVGEAAKSKAPRLGRNAVHNVAQLLGLDHAQLCELARARAVGSDAPAFEVSDGGGKGSRHAVRVSYKGQGVDFTAERLASLVLERARATAGDAQGQRPDGCVLTVAVTATSAFREALTRAAERAGLRASCLLHAPLAVAMAHGLDDPSAPSSYHALALVVDAGATGVRCSVVEARGGFLRLLAHSLSSGCSGEAMDERVVAQLTREFARRARGSGVDVKRSARAMGRLRAAAAEARRVLSRSPRTTVSLESLCEGIDFQAPVTRARLEMETGDLIRAATACADRAWAAAAAPGSPDRVLLAGGLAHMPAFRAAFARKGRRAPECLDAPEEAAARGAAVQAGVLNALAQAREEAGLGDVEEGEGEEGRALLAERGDPHAPKLTVPGDATAPAVDKGEGEEGEEGEAGEEGEEEEEEDGEALEAAAKEGAAVQPSRQRKAEVAGAATVRVAGCTLCLETREGAPLPLLHAGSKLPATCTLSFAAFPRSGGDTGSARAAVRLVTPGGAALAETEVEFAAEAGQPAAKPEEGEGAEGEASEGGSWRELLARLPPSPSLLITLRVSADGSIDLLARCPASGGMAAARLTAAEATAAAAAVEDECPGEVVAAVGKAVECYDALRRMSEGARRAVAGEDTREYLEGEEVDEVGAAAGAAEAWLAEGGARLVQAWRDADAMALGEAAAAAAAQCEALHSSVGDLLLDLADDREEGTAGEGAEGAAAPAAGGEGQDGGEAEGVVAGEGAREHVQATVHALGVELDMD